jgi:rhodanese-related sulfurtransferase
MAIKTIAPTEFQRLLNNGHPLTLLDVRTPAEFARVHIVGARSIPLDTLDPSAALGAACCKNGEPIYVVCQSGGRAARACDQFEKAGVANVYSIEGGTSAWEKMGLPVERGSTNVISLERQVRIGAGTLVLLGVILAWTIHPAFIGISAFVGAGLVFAGITDYCGMAMILGKMAWNR